MGDELLSYNLFGYCANNPVMGYDPYGTWDWNLGKIALTTLVVAGAIAFASTIGTIAVVMTCITIACAAIDGGICAEVSGGDFWDGFMAGAIGGSVSATINNLIPLPAAEDTLLRGNVAARAAGTITYDLGYELFSTGGISSKGVGVCVVDTIMDSLYSCVIYGNHLPISNQAYQTLVNGIADGIVDVYQTEHMFNDEVPEWARVQKQGG